MSDAPGAATFGGPAEASDRHIGRCRLGVDDDPFRLAAGAWIVTGRVR